MKRIFLIVLASFTFNCMASFSTLTLENDCFLPDKSLGRGDEDFTHGTGFEYVDNNFIHYKVG